MALGMDFSTLWNSCMYMFLVEPWMRIFFVASASLWAWLVGRCIAFGPTPRGLCWQPTMGADTWYRLTPIPCKVPHKYFPLIAFAFACAAVPALFVPNDLIHVATVLRLVSEHAFLPMFVAHIHSDRALAIWSGCNLLAGIGTVTIAIPEFPLGALGTALGCLVDLWFMHIQLYLCCYQEPIREQNEYEARQPRLV